MSYPVVRNLQVTADLYYLSYDSNAAFWPAPMPTGWCLTRAQLST